MTDSLLRPTDVRALANRLGLRPTKRLGQNFVVDPNTVRRIAAAAELSSDDVVLEVGPGLGSLTLALLPQVQHVVAVEIDPVLAASLPETVREHAPSRAGDLTVVAADAMEVATLPVTPTACVANLPYNVAVPVLLHVLQAFPSLRHGLVMVQAEVADRLVAPPGSRTYGIPTVKLAWYATARRVGAVPPAVFWPVPRVDSGLVAFTCHEPPSAVSSRAEVFAVVDAAFAQRRKSLRAALAGWAGSPGRAEELLRAAGVDPRLRGEALTLEQFTAVADAAR